jgi:hypothetical protein
MALGAPSRYAQQGLTLGPTTRQLLAEMMASETPFLNREPYASGRFG